jgi:hypothetical protein
MDKNLGSPGPPGPCSAAHAAPSPGSHRPPPRPPPPLPPRPRPRPPPSPTPRPCFASLTCPCCRLGTFGLRSLTPRLVALQKRRPRGRLNTRPRRPRRLPALRFRPRRHPGRLPMHARRPRALLCLCRRRPPIRNRVRSWRLIPSRRSTHRFGRSLCTDRDRWVSWGKEAKEGETWDRETEPLSKASGSGL